MFHRERHRVLNTQPLVKPNDKRRGEPHGNATQGGAVGAPEQLRGEFDEEVGGASLVLREGVREVHLFDEAVGRKLPRTLRLLRLSGLREVSRPPVCLRHFTHRIDRDWGFCFEIGFFGWVR